MQTEYERQEISSANERPASAASGDLSELQSLFSARARRGRNAICINPHPSACEREASGSGRYCDGFGEASPAGNLRFRAPVVSTSTSRYLNHVIPCIWDPRVLRAPNRRDTMCIICIPRFPSLAFNGKTNVKTRDRKARKTKKKEEAALT